jgi:hypothetical protein
MFPTSEIYLQAEIAYRRDRLTTDRRARDVRRSARRSRARAAPARPTRPTAPGALTDGL